MDLSKKIQMNFIELASQLDLIDFIHELSEHCLICPYDYDILVSKTRIERNFLFFMNIDVYSEKAQEYFLSWLKKANNGLYTKLICTDIKPNIVPTSEQFETARKEQNLIRKQLVLMLKRINANAIAPQLFQDGFLNRDHLERIFVLQTRKQRSHELLNQIIGRLTNTQILLGILKSVLNALRIYQPDLHDEFVAKNLSVEPLSSA